MRHVHGAVGGVARPSGLVSLVGSVGSVRSVSLVRPASPASPVSVGEGGAVMGMNRIHWRYVSSEAS